MRLPPSVLFSAWFLAAHSAAPCPVLGQSDSTRILIVGTVVDPLRNPIEAAEVFVIGGSSRVMTSSEGTFRIYAPRGTAKEFLVQVRRPGYSAQLLKLTDGWTGTILLQPGNYRLPEVQVTARYAKPVRYAGTTKYDDYFRRRRLGFGQFISREEIDFRQPMTTLDLFSGRAGIRTSIQPPGAAGGSSIHFARCHEEPPKINVYIDGRRMMPQAIMSAPAKSVSDAAKGGSDEQLGARREAMAATGEMLERINPSDIELVEIYRGPGQLPAEFHEDNCGAIAVWTRWAGR